MIREVEKYCRGMCAHCGAEDLEYIDDTIEDECIYFTFKCNHCGNYGREYYGLHYETTIVEIDEE